MKVAYIFSSPRCSSYKLGQMILPQLQQNRHGVEVVGMFFFDDNTFALRKGDPLGEAVAKIAKEKNILLMLCDQCAAERNLAVANPDDKTKYIPHDTVEGVHVGCFPDLYQALSGNPPDQVVTL